MHRLIEEKRYVELRDLLVEMNVVDVAEMLSQIKDDKHVVLAFRILPKETAAEAFAYLEHDLQQLIVEGITDRELAGLLSELFMDDTVDFVDEMPASIVKRVLKSADKDTREHINKLLMYPDRSAGSLMTIEYIKVSGNLTVRQAIADIRKKSADVESIAVLFVTDAQRHLLGSVALKEVLSGDDDQLISDLMDPGILSVNTHDAQDEVAAKFNKYDLLTVPVVDNENRLVGIITIDDAVDVMVEETTEDIYRMAAMEPIETSYLSTGVFALARGRIVWLLVLMVSSTLTGVIIERFNHALTANVMLAAFIPMLMNTSGNAGSQTAASIIRSLVLGEVGLKDLPAVLWKELRVSLVAGAVVSGFNFLRVLIFYKSLPLAIIVSVTLSVVIMAAELVGGALPMLATKLKLDPALMATPMITTIVDALSLLVYFVIATLVFSRIPA